MSLVLRYFPLSHLEVSLVGEEERDFWQRKGFFSLVWGESQVKDLCDWWKARHGLVTCAPLHTVLGFWEYFWSGLINPYSAVWIYNGFWSGFMKLRLPSSLQCKLASQANSQKLLRNVGINRSEVFWVFDEILRRRGFLTCRLSLLVCKSWSTTHPYWVCMDG